MSRALTLKEIGRVRRALRLIAPCFLTQAALADALGVSQQSVSAVLSGVQFPGIRFALGVARASGTSLEALLSTPSAEHKQVPHRFSGSCADAAA